MPPAPLKIRAAAGLRAVFQQSPANENVTLPTANFARFQSVGWQTWQNRSGCAGASAKIVPKPQR